MIVEIHFVSRSCIGHRLEMLPWIHFDSVT